MKKMVRGALAFMTLVGFAACVDDPQERINNDDFKTLQAYPEVAWVRVANDSTPIYFRLINDFGYGTPTHLTLSDVTGPITVKLDSAFRAYYTGQPVNPFDTTLIISPEDTAATPYVDGHLQRYFVYHHEPGEGSFKVTASNGVSTTVRVRVEASDLGALPVANAIGGQLITLNAPAFSKFLPDAQVTYNRGQRPDKFPTLADAARGGTATSAGPVVARAADGSSLTFRAAYDLYGKVTVTRTIPTHSGISESFTAIGLTTTDTLKVPGFGTARGLDYVFGITTDTVSAVGGTFTVGGVPTSTPNPGDIVTVTLGGLPGSLGSAAGNNPLAFLANTRIFIGGVEAGVVHTANNPPVAAIGADSTTVQIHVPAHVSPPGVQTTVPVTLTNSAAAFDPTYLFGTTAAGTTTVQAGTPAVLKIGTLSGTGNPPNTLGAIVGNATGTNSRATAPQLPKISFFPTSAANARSYMVNDANDFPTGGECASITGLGTATGGCKIYKLALETTTIVDAELRWSSGAGSSTMGVYILANAPSTTVNALRANTASTTGGVASGALTVNPASAGQYIVVTWSAGVKPLWTSMRVTLR